MLRSTALRFTAPARLLGFDAGDWSMWLDDQFKLVRILVASDNTEVVRD